MHVKNSLLALILSLTALVSAANSVAELPAKAPTDQSEYRKIILENGLKVILLSDPDLNISSASVAVKVGSMGDPKERPGIAHFLEHMLFLGTEKYPDEGEYGEYLRSNGGYSNAYTSLELTNYHFEVAHHAFEGALDRMAQFFIAPLFTAEFTEREMNAVDSEFEVNLERDVWRNQRLRRHLSDPNHPYSNFAIGNLATLTGIERREFIEFFDRHYSANQMALALTGTASLDQMEAWARTYFSPIENKNVERITFEQRFLPPGDAARIAYINPVQEMQDLWMTFNIPSMRDRYAGKAGELLSYVLGYEGQGSLLSILKAEGLATQAYASPDYTSDDFGILYTGASLTPKGIANYDRVLELFYGYFELLRNAPYPAHLFEEQGYLARLNELYTDKGEGAGRAVDLANAALNFPLADAERTEFIWAEPDQDGYFEILDYLRPANMLALVIGKELPTDSVEPYFGSEYTLHEHTGELYARLADAQPAAGLTVPGANPFIPDDATLIADRPTLLIDEPGLQLFYSQDQEFERPRAAYVFRIRQPEAMTDLRSSVLKGLYIDAINEMMNEVTYDARLAGLNFSLSQDLEGIRIAVDGYGQSASTLLDYIVTHLPHLDLPEERFQALKDLQLRSLASFNRQDAYIQAVELHRKAGLNQYYSPPEILPVATAISYEDVKAFGETLFNQGKIESVIHGNLTDAQAIAAARMVQTKLGLAMPAGTALFDLEARAPEAGEDQVLPAQLIVNNSTYWQEYIMGEDRPDLRAASIVIRNFISSPFYTEMRTRQQLGYIVWAFTTRREQLIHTGFVIQSADFGPTELRESAEAFIQTFPTLWSELTPEQFQTLISAARSEIVEKDKSIAERTSSYFSRAFQHDGDWDRQRATLAALDALTAEDVGDIIAATIAPETRRLRTVLAHAAQHAMPES
jgi:insulysin